MAPAPINVPGAIVMELRSVAFTPMNEYVRGDEAVVLDRRVMSDVVAAPEGDVVADRDERLDRVVLEDETVVTRRLRQVRAAGADVGFEPIAGVLHLGILRGAHV